MKLKQLKSIVNASQINIIHDFYNPVHYQRINTEMYVSIDDGLKEDAMYKKYGEYEVEQITSEDKHTINIYLVYNAN